MITANLDVNIAQFVTAFNQLVDIHIVNILAIAERENYPINLWSRKAKSLNPMSLKEMQQILLRLSPC